MKLSGRANMWEPCEIQTIPENTRLSKSNHGKVYFRCWNNLFASSAHTHLVIYFHGLGRVEWAKRARSPNFYFSMIWHVNMSREAMKRSTSAICLRFSVLFFYFVFTGGHNKKRLTNVKYSYYYYHVRELSIYRSIFREWSSNMPFPFDCSGLRDS